MTRLRFYLKSRILRQGSIFVRVIVGVVVLVIVRVVVVGGVWILVRIFHLRVLDDEHVEGHDLRRGKIGH